VVRFDSDTNALTEIPTKGDRPGPRSGNTAVVWDGCMYIFGGRDGNSHFDDIYQLKLLNRRWEKIEPATDMRCPARYRHSSVVHNGKMYSFGGEIGGEGEKQVGFFFVIYNVSKVEVVTAICIVSISSAARGSW
jgi:N-acetylneuraminic acid mutarotase